MSRVALIGALATAVAGAASAQEPAWSVEGSAGVVSDYRYRGYSLSGGDLAWQGGLTLGHASGFYGGADVSTIEAYGTDSDGDGAELELTLTGGWAGTVAGLDVDAGVAAYRYPDGSDVDYVEMPAQASRNLGPLTWTIGVAYAPAQASLSNDDNSYIWSGADLAPGAWPVSITASLGYEEGAYAPDGKTDWLVGLNAPLGPVTLGVAWIDSDANTGALVGSVFVSF